jgi:hypothetical protein
MMAAVAFLVAWVAYRGEQLGPVGSAVFQVIVVVLSIFGAWVFIRDGTDQHVRGIARASARRVMVNYSVVGNLAAEIDELRSLLRNYVSDKGELNPEVVDMALRGLQQQISSQLVSADAAIKDWRDLAPTEIDEELRSIETKELGRDG